MAGIEVMTSGYVGQGRQDRSGYTWISRVDKVAAMRVRSG